MGLLKDAKAFVGFGTSPTATDYATNMDFDEWKRKPLKTLLKVLSDVSACQLLQSEPALTAIRYCTAQELRDAMSTIRVKSWLLSALEEAHRGNPSVCSEDGFFGFLVQNVCIALKGDQAVVFLMPTFAPHTLLRYFQAQQVLTSSGLSLAKLAELSLAMPDEPSNKALLRLVLGNCNTKENLDSFIAGWSQSLRSRPAVVLAVSERYFTVAGVDGALQWIRESTREPLAAATTMGCLLDSVQNVPVEGRKAWLTHSLALYCALRPNEKRLNDFVPSDLIATAELIVKALIPLDSMTIAEARYIESRWMAPCIGDKSLEEMCSIVSGRRCYFDIRVLAEIQQKFSIVEQFVNSVTESCTELHRCFGTDWWKSDLSAAQRCLTRDTIGTLRVSNRYFNHLEAFLLLSENNRRTIIDLLGKRQLVSKMIADRVITIESLKNPEMLVSSIQQKIAENLGPTATVQQVYEFCRDSGLPLPGLSLADLERYRSLYPQLVRALPTLRLVIKVFSEQKPFGNLFFAGSEDRLLSNGAPETLTLERLKTKCDPTVTLASGVDRQLQFLIKFCAPTVAKFRLFLQDNRSDLAKLPDVMRKKRQLELPLANQAIAFLEDFKVLFDANPDIDDVFRLCPDGQTQLDEFEAFLGKSSEHITKLTDLISTSSTKDLLDLQQVIRVVNSQRLDVQLLYHDGLPLAEMLCDPFRFSFQDERNVKIFAGAIERHFRSCSLMPPNTMRRLRADVFIKTVTAARYAMTTFSRLLHTQSQLILVQNEHDAFEQEFVISKNQVRRRDACVPISVKEVVSCIKNASETELMARRSVQNARNKYAHLAFLSDGDYQRIYRYLSQRIDNQDDCKTCADTLVLRLGILPSVAVSSLQSGRQFRIRQPLPIQNLSEPLLRILPISPMLPTDKPLPSEVYFHDVTASPYLWCEELLCLYASKVKRLPLYSEMLLLSSSAFDTARSGVRYLCQKASTAKGTLLFSIVVACNSSDAPGLVEIISSQFQMYVASAKKDTNKVGHPIHIFLTVEAPYFQAKLHEACGDVPVSVAPCISQPSLKKEVQLLLKQAPVVVYATAEVRQGKSTLIKRQKCVTHTMLLHYANRFTPFTALSQRSSVGPHWIELGAVVTQDVIISLFEFFVLGGIVSPSGIATPLSRSCHYLLEVPFGSSEECSLFSLFPSAAGLTVRPRPTNCPPYTCQIEPSIVTEFEHGRVHCANFMTKIAKSWPQSPALQAAIHRTAEYVCCPDTNPLIDIKAWETRATHIPVHVPYFLTWFMDAAGTAVPIIISNGATQQEVADLSAQIKVVNIADKAMTQEALVEAFLQGIGATPTPQRLELLKKYVVTRHTLMAAIRISIAIRTACCPSVIVGETGCGKTHLMSIICACLDLPSTIIDVHPGLVWDVEEHMKRRAVAGRLPDDAARVEQPTLKQRLLNEIEKSPKGEKHLLFFDELNNWPKQDIIKALMLDRSYDGVTLPREWIVVGACNPYRLTNSTNSSPNGSLVYSVQPRTHPSLRAYAWTFGNSQPHEEAAIARAMCSGANLTPEATTFLVDAIPSIHTKIREQHKERIISFRDTSRCVRLSRELKPIFDALFEDLAATPLQIARVALMLSYIVGIDSVVPLRHLLEVDFADCVTFFRNVGRYLFAKVAAMDPYIRRNETVEETLLVVLLSIYSRTPLIIVGPPGTGKSLAPHLITEAAAELEEFRKLQIVVRYNFQCTVDTRSTALDEAFGTAKDLRQNVIAVVLVDELGLADASLSRPLKVLNKWLDHEGTSHTELYPVFVGTTNPLIDRSIMNRCICLFRQIPDKDTLRKMLLDIQLPQLAQHNDRIVDKVYETATGSFEWNDRLLFGMRDFFSLLRDGQQIVKGLNVKGAEEIRREVESSIIKSCGHDAVGVFPDKKNLREVQRSLLKLSLSKSSSRPLMVHSESFSAARELLKKFLPTSHRTAAEPLPPSMFICGRILGFDPGMLSFQLQKVMTAMQAGIPIVLVDASYLYESLMAVLNGSVVRSGNKTLSRIAFDGESEYCEVKEKFRVILLIVEGRQRKTSVENSTAFADRFERHYIPHDDKYTQKMVEWTNFESLIVYLPPILRDSLGELLRLPGNAKHLIFGFHNSMLRFAENDIDIGQSTDTRVEKRIRSTLRLIHIPTLLTKLRLTKVVDGQCVPKFSVEECIKICEEVLTFQSIKPLLHNNRFLCTFITAPADEIVFSSVEDLLKKIIACSPDDAVEVEDVDEDVLRRRRLPMLEDPHTICLGPYTSLTPDGFVHLELDQALTQDRARVVIVLRVEQEESSRVLSYPLFALCEAINELATATTRVLLLVLCDADSPGIQLDFHNCWSYTCLNSLQPPSHYVKPFVDMKQHLFRQMELTLPISDKRMAVWMEDVLNRLSNVAIHDLSKGFVKEARQQANSVMLDSSPSSTLKGQQISLGHFRALFTALSDAIAVYFGLMSLHRMNLRLLNAASSNVLLSSGIDVRFVAFNAMLDYVRGVALPLKEGGSKPFFANPLIDELFFGADVGNGQLEEGQKALRKSIQRHSSNCDIALDTIFLHRLWLHSGVITGKNFPTQALRGRSIESQLRLLYFIAQQKKVADDVKTYLKSPVPVAMETNRTLYLIPLEDVADEGVGLVEEKLSAPRWVRTLLTTFGPLSTQLVGIQSVTDLSNLPLVIQQSKPMLLEYLITMARHFPTAFQSLRFNEGNPAVSEEMDVSPSTAVIKLGGIPSPLRLTLEKLSHHMMRPPAPPIKRIAHLTALENVNETTLPPTVWSTFYRFVEEVEHAGNPGAKIVKLAPAAFYLYEFLQGNKEEYGNFPQSMLDMLCWEHAPRLVHECNPLSFDADENLKSSVWPKMIESLNNYVGEYNQLCRKFFDHVLEPFRGLNDVSTTMTEEIPKYFVIPPAGNWEITLPMDKHSGFLSVTPWTPMLQLSALLEIAAATNGVSNVPSVTEDSEWSDYDVPSMILLSYCRDLALGLKRLTVIVSTECITAFPAVPLSNLTSFVVPEQNIPSVLKAPCDQTLLQSLLDNSELRIEIRRHGTALLRNIVDKLASLSSSVDATQYMELPLSNVQTLISDERFQRALQSPSSEVKIKHVWDVIRAVFAFHS